MLDFLKTVWRQFFPYKPIAGSESGKMLWIWICNTAVKDRIKFEVGRLSAANGRKNRRSEGGGGGQLTDGQFTEVKGLFVIGKTH